MASLHVYSPSETQTHASGAFSPLIHGYPTSTYSESTQSPPTSPLKYNQANTNLLNLPPATDSLIAPEQQPSLTARLHRRKKTYQPPTAPAIHASNLMIHYERRDLHGDYRKNMRNKYELKRNKWDRVPLAFNDNKGNLCDRQSPHKVGRSEGR